MGLVGTSGDQPSLPISPILSNTPEESVVGSPASSREEPDTPSGTGSLPDAILGYSPLDLSQPILTSPAVVFSDIPDCLTSRDIRRSPDPVPRWWLAREGHFLSERSSSSLNCFGDGCSFRNTTYRPSDYTRSLVFHYIILGFWNGLARQSLLVCWKWDRGCGYTLYCGNRLWMWLSNFNGMCV